MDYKLIYNTRGEDYERLVSREDYEGNLLRVIQQIRPLSNLTVVESGAGTGRITTMLAPHVKAIHAFDAAAHMLSFATAKLEKMDEVEWATAVADHRHIPVDENSADMLIVGWSLGHLQGWYPDNWQQELQTILTEMKRIVKPGGTLLIIETLGTGRKTPMPPSLGLAQYYHCLETEHRFNTTWIRTDYLFASVQEAAELAGFFFGETMANDILAQNINILPECTGLWWLTNE